MGVMLRPPAGDPVHALPPSPPSPARAGGSSDLDGESEPELVRDLRGRSHHWITRELLLRGLGLVYAVAFAVAVNQLPGLIGARGILPVSLFLQEQRLEYGAAAYIRVPTVFWLGCSDAALGAASWIGLAGSVAVLCGATNALLMALLWALYLSIVHVGQVWYGYGWEILLCEAGFLAIFLCPLRGIRPLPERDAPPAIVVWLYRWLAFRLMIGAGLIKIRGDACWRDLSCMQFHYETQPVPSPLSWWLHQLPPWFHRAEVGFNHFVELVVPWFLFAPRPWRTVAGCFLVAFQLLLIASGNLSFLNWLTLVICLSAFDDEAIARALPRLRARIAALARRPDEPSRLRRGAVVALLILVSVLSFGPVTNLLSSRQAMNTSFEPFDLVNTYGAFGTVGRERDEIVIQGTSDAEPGPDTRWLDYELPCKPGDPLRRPCLITPYHYRLDWQAWFAPFYRPEQQPWLWHLLYQLLSGERAVLRLFAKNPFATAPPRWVRVVLYRYRFARAGEPGWWIRTPLGGYFRPVSLDDGEFAATIAQQGWDVSP